MAVPSIAWIGGGTVKGVGAVAPTWGTVLANDILIAIAETSNTDTFDSDAAFGGSAVTSSPVTQGGTKLWAKWFRAVGGETLRTFIDPGDHQIVCVLCIRGCVTTGNPFDATPAASTDPTPDVSGSATGYTTLGPDRLVVVAAAGDLPDATNTTDVSGQTNANLTLIAEQFDNSTNAGNGGNLMVMTGVKAAAGAVGATTFTKVAAAVKAMLVIAFIPGAPLVTGTATASLAFTATQTGKRTVKGTATADLTLTGTEAGLRTVKGAAQANPLFSAAALGVVSGGGGTVLGTALAALTFDGTALGKRTVKGTASASLTLTGTETGKRTVKGAAAAAELFAAVAAGRRTVKGAAAATPAFTASASGVVSGGAGTVFGSAAASLSFAAVAGGLRTVRGTALSLLTFSARADVVQAAEQITLWAVIEEGRTNAMITEGAAATVEAGRLTALVET